MDVLGGHQLMNKKRQLMTSEAALQNAEIICYYFSAHWCPPCRNFTPVLADCYTDMKESGASIECIFVSSDRSESEMMQYMAESHADWLAVPWGKQIAANLKSKYSVRGIPCLIVVRRNGRLITTDGRGDVQRFGANCFQQWMAR